MGINGPKDLVLFWRVHELEQILKMKSRKKNHVWPENENCPFVLAWKYGGMICSPPTHKLHHGILYRSDKNRQSDSQTYHLAEPSHKDSIIPSPVCLILLACFFELLLLMAETPIPRSLVVYLMVRDWKTFVHTRNLAPPGMYGKTCRN